jgi:pimeloyl-ACP methyl ester carboxylesterase
MIVVLCGCGGAHIQAQRRSPPRVSPGVASARRLSGVIGSTRYAVVVPSAWNSFVVIMVRGPAQNPAAVPSVEGRLARALMARGYAIAAITAIQKGWAIRSTAGEEAALALRIRRSLPTARIIVAGSSYGGGVAAAAVELHPSEFAGGLPMCGVLADSQSFFGLELDLLYAFARLISPRLLGELATVPNLMRAISYARADFASAERTTLGRARLALVAALGDYSGWVAGEVSPPRDANALLRGQLSALLGTIEAMLARRALAARTIGASPVGNESTNYLTEYARSIYRTEVHTLYTAAGISPAVDIARLNDGVRIPDTSKGERWLIDNYAFTGRVHVPVVAIDGTGDDWLTSAQGVYQQKAARSGSSSMYRQLWIARPGHCNFTLEEKLVALQTLAARITSGRWPDTRAGTLNDRGTNTRFAQLSPPPYPRPSHSDPHGRTN